MRHKGNVLLSFLIVSVFIIIVSGTDVAVPSGWRPEDLEQEVYRLVNQHRTREGFSRLRWSEEIAKECRIHSRNMASAKTQLSHEGLDERMRRIKKKIDFLRGAENVAFNERVKDPAREAIETWLKSSGHRANIEGEYDMTGVGIAKNKEGRYYFTQVFIKKRAKD
jgi:uncharacterized protein YkwD